MRLSLMSRRKRSDKYRVVRDQRFDYRGKASAHDERLKRLLRPDLCEVDRNRRAGNRETSPCHPKTVHTVITDASSMTNPNARFSFFVGSRCDAVTPTGARNIAGTATVSAAVQQTRPTRPF